MGYENDLLNFTYLVSQDRLEIFSCLESTNLEINLF